MNFKALQKPRRDQPREYLIGVSVDVAPGVDIESFGVIEESRGEIEELHSLSGKLLAVLLELREEVSGKHGVGLFRSEAE